MSGYRLKPIRPFTQPVTCSSSVKATGEQPEKITHVAIYLGDGKIIHASGRVQVESLKRGAPTSRNTG